MTNKKPSRKELAALLQTLIILAGDNVSGSKEKHNIIESICKKYDFYPEVLEITSVDPCDVFAHIEEMEIRLQFASHLISLVEAGNEEYIDAHHLSYLSKLLSILSQ